MNPLRRKFIKDLAITGLVASGIPPISYSESTIKSIKPKAGKGEVFLFQGDSITDGNRGRNNDPNHIMGHGYAFSIASRLGADHPEMQYQFINRGVSGNTIIDTIDLKPDILSILIGINDATSAIFHWDHAVTVSQYEQVFIDLLSQTLEKYPDIFLVLCEPFILKVGHVAENWEAYHRDISERQGIVRRLAEQYQAVFVGFQEVFDEASRETNADYWIWDGIHPTVAGHELMAREWMKRVKKNLVI